MNDRHHIGGGNVAGILGVSPYKSPLDEYLTIIGDAEAPTRERLDFFKRRKSFEPVAAEAFTERTGLAIVGANRRVTDAEHPFIKAEIDLETEDDCNVEVKTAHPFAAREWGPEGDDACPVFVTAQAMHGLAVTGRDLCYVLAMIGFDDVRLYRIHRDDETIRAMCAREVAFWNDHVLARVPPQPVTDSDMVKLFAKDDGSAVEANPEVAAVVDALRDRKARAKELEGEIEQLETGVRLYMAEAATLTYQGRALATWKAQTARRLDQRALAEAHPEITETFKRASETRVLRIR